MCSDDLEEFRQRTGLVQRKKVAEQAGQKGIKLPADFHPVTASTGICCHKEYLLSSCGWEVLLYLALSYLFGKIGRAHV